MKNPGFVVAAFLMITLASLEAYCLTYGLLRFSLRLNSWLYCISGLAIGTLCLFKIQRPHTFGPKWLKWLMPLPLFYLLYQTLPEAMNLMQKVPVDYHVADMLPIMEIMCKRLVNGTGVYRDIPEIWGGMFPIYLPAMWLPYLFATEIGFDLRWVTLFFFIGGVALAAFVVPRGRRLTWFSLLAWYPVFWVFYSFLFRESNDFSMGDEGSVVGFYLLLAWALWQGNPWLIGVALALSVLTRYSLLPWIPFFMLYVGFFQSRARAIKMGGIALGVGLLLMGGTGAIFHLKTFISLPKHYLTALFSEDYWKLEPTIKGSLGLAKFFSKADLPLLYKLQLGFAFGIPALCLLAYTRFRKLFDPLFFGLATLKLCLVVFFNLLIIPIHNLFLTSNFLTLALLFFYIQGRDDLEGRPDRVTVKILP